MTNTGWRRPSPAARAGLLAACGALLVGAALWAGSIGPWVARPQGPVQERDLPTLTSVPTPPPLPPPPADSTPSSGSAFDPTIVLWVLGGVLLVALLVAVAAMLRNRAPAAPARRRAPDGVEPPVPEVSAPDPDRGFDPREAADYVIACWEQLERVAASRGMPRRPEQTPTEFLEAVQIGHPLDGRAAGELLALYQRARFDHIRLLPDTAVRARACLDALLPAVGADQHTGLQVGP